MIPPIPNITSSSSAALDTNATGPTFGNMTATNAMGGGAGVSPGWILGGLAVAAVVGFLALRKKKG